MSSKIQTMTLGLALAAAGFAGAAFVQQADAERGTYATDHAIAYVDVFGLIDEIIKGAEYEAARNEYDTAQQAQLAQMQTQMQTLQAQIQMATDPDSPDVQGLYAQGQQLQQQMQQFYQNYQDQMQQLIGSQIADAYKLIYAAAGEEAAEQGVHFMFASRPDSDLLVDTLSGVAQEILARPLIAPSDSINMTGAIRERLGLPDPAEAAEIPETPAAEVPVESEPAEAPADEPTNTDPMSDDG